MKTRFKALKIMLFGLALGGLGVSVWFISSAIFSSFQKTNEGNYLDPTNKEVITLEKSADVPVKLIEHENSGFYFFGKKGLELINEKIKSELQFGPEVETLKAIRINNLAILSQNVSGQYNPFTQEMEISISNLVRPFRDIPVEEKIELVFPTIFHEYGHHFANTYITSIATNDPRNSKKLYTKFGKNSIHKNIPKKFLNEFEESLHYSDTPINNLLSNSKTDVSGVKTARDLYLESNGINIKNNTDGSDFLNIDNLHLTTKIPFRNKIQNFPITSSRYTYLFSIDELLTRKLQQISYIDILNGIAIANNSTTFTGTEYRDGFSPSTIGSDIAKNKQIDWLGGNTYKVGEELLLLDYPYGGTFTSKNGDIYNIDPTVERLWNAYYDVGGYNYGISQIYLENNSIQANRTSRTPLNTRSFTNIKFTGFLNNLKSTGEKNNYKGLLLKNKEGFYQEQKFIKNNYRYKILGAKSDILSHTVNLLKPSMKFGYSTEYIDISKFNINEPIRVWNDLNNNDKFETSESEALTVSPDRPTTTFRESFVRTFEDGSTHRDADIRGNFYQIVTNSNEAFLEIYGVNNGLELPILFSEQEVSTRSTPINIGDDVIMFNRWYDKKKR